MRSLNIHFGTFKFYDVASYLIHSVMLSELSSIPSIIYNSSDNRVVVSRSYLRLIADRRSCGN